MNTFEEVYNKHVVPFDEDAFKLELTQIFQVCFAKRPEIKLLGIRACEHSNEVFIIAKDYFIGDEIIGAIESLKYDIYNDEEYSLNEKSSECLEKEAEEYCKDLKTLTTMSGPEIEIPPEVDLYYIIKSNNESAPYSDVNGIITLLEVQEVSHHLYGTNYMITATMESDGSIMINRQDCEPPY